MWGWSSRYDWFDKLMGFTERSYEYSKSKMAVETVNGEQMLKSLESGKSYGCGELELVSLEALRARVAALPQNSLFVPGSNKLKLSCEQGDVRRMHPNFPGALFQVASQFNLLEMVGPGQRDDKKKKRKKQKFTKTKRSHARRWGFWLCW